MTTEQQQWANLAAWELGTSTPQAGGRSPTNWQPSGGFEVPASPDFMQLAGYQPGRNTIVIVNTGANDAKLNNAQTVQGGASPITLSAGGTWTLTTEGEVWVQSDLGTSLDIVVTFSPVVSSSFAPGGQIPYVGNVLP